MGNQGSQLSDDMEGARRDMHHFDHTFRGVLVQCSGTKFEGENN